MSKEFKIDKNIPIPIRSKYPFADMKIGDSFFEEGQREVQAKLSNSAHMWCKRNNKDWKFTVRKYETGFRVWRTK